MKQSFTLTSRNGLLVFMMCALVHIGAFAQSSPKILSDISENEIVVTGQRYTFPRHYRTLHLNKPAAQQFFSTAPAETPASIKSSSSIFEMPMPDGSTAHFRIWQTPVMQPDLAAQFPDIKTYAGQGTDDPAASIRLDMTPLGFHAMVLSPKGSVWIDPYCVNTTDDYICYFKSDLSPSGNFVCETEARRSNVDNYRDIIPHDLYTAKVAGAQLRTYRLALACTGEYAATKGGTVAGAMAGIVTSINRVDGVYETEVAIRMVLISNNSSIVYTNSSTDPYTNNNGSTMLGQNQTTCTNVIGSANYDIGHVFSTGGGGVALLGCVCSSSTKAEGVTGSPNPVGDAYDIDYVAHEMGHQFGGNHTFNSTTGSCGGGNRASSAAYEPGSGVTVMAYAGICGADDLDAHSIAYFHTYSFDEIVNYTTTGNGNSCPVTTASGNNPPNVTSQGANYTIPVSTPFVLTGAATDPDGDPLTYSWEEMDLGPAGGLNVQSTTAPQFRPFSPVTSPSRTFPKLSSIISNTASVGEWLPNQARSLKFRLTARDNKMGGGGVMHPDVNVTVTVANTGGAFAVTAPNTAVTWAGGSTQAVTWNVNGTSGSPINCANVMISLSTDGGNTFPTVLLASTANDGTENITVPNVANITARIKVEAVGNIFFDMSNVNFTITAASGLTAISTSTISPSSFCAGSSLNVGYTTTGSANAGNVFTAQLSNASGSFASPVAIGTLSATSSGTIAAVIPAGTATGSGYLIRVVSSNPVVTGTASGTVLSISAQVAAAGSISTASTSFCANLPITFNTSAISNATTYTWAATGGAVVSSGQGTLSAVIVFPNTISTSTVSVFGSNANCTGTSSTLVVTIMATPNVPTANSATGCSGTPITLTGSPAGGSFSVANPYSGSSTTFTYTITNGNGCNTTSNPANITVNSSPATTVTGTTAFCSGSSTSFSAGAGFSSYNWSTGATTQSININTAGTFTVTVSNASGCTGSASRTSTVNSNPAPSISGSLAFCSGSSSTLNAGAGFSSYNWSTGATTQTINANTASTFTVTVTNANGCSGSATAITTVNANPTPSISGSLAFCSGSSTTLNAGAGFSSYSWSTGATTQTINANTTSTFTVTVTNANGCSGSATVTTTVNANPTPSISGSLSFCSGGSTTLDAGTGFSSYNWSTGATTQSINVTTSNTFTVTVTNANGCSGSTSVTTTVSSGLTPTITGSISFCAGNSTTLNAGSGYSSYNWSTGATTQNISVNTAGTFTVTVTNASGCTGSATASTTVNANPSTSVTGNTSFCSGSSTILSAGAGFSSYNWSTGATTQAITINAGGIYTVTVTNANGCSGSASVSTSVNPLPSVSFSGLASSYNVSAAAATLTGSPVGGSFSGAGISGNTFSPSSAGVGGPYTITYSYTDGNGCSNSSSQQTTVTNCTLPAMPGTISTAGGITKVCPGDTRTYTVAAVSGATSYTWTPPAGGNITAGTGTRSVTINYAAGYSASDTLRVTANNACGSSVQRKLNIVRNNPTIPGTITGQTYGVCNTSSLPYSVTAVSGITYSWSLSVTTASVSTGLGSNAITASYAPAFSTGVLGVTANNGCGASPSRNLTVKAIPATPTAITGSATACAHQSGVPYSIAPITSAINYTWTVPAGATIFDGTVTSSGTSLVTTSTAVSVNFGATAGVVRARANNSCGSSAYKSLTVSFNCREINQNELFDFTISPNPAQHATEIIFESSQDSKYILQLMDLTGRIVILEEGNAAEGENRAALNLENISKGIYMLRVINGDEQSFKRLLVN